MNRRSDSVSAAALGVLLGWLLLPEPAAASASLAVGAQEHWSRQVAELESAGDSDGAIAVVEAHLRSDAQDPEAWAWLAGAFERLVDVDGRPVELLEEAAIAWEAVAELQPNTTHAALGAGRNWLRVGDNRAAQAWSQRVLDACDERAAAGDPDAVASAARAAALRLEAQTASFLEPSSQSPLAFARALGDHLVAIEAARRLAPLSGDTADAGESVVIAHASWLESLALADFAQDVLRTALRESPDSIALHSAWIALYQRLENEPELSAEYAALVEEFPESSVLRWYAGYADRLLGDLRSRERRDADAVIAYERCVVSMRKAAELDPTIGETALWIEMQARSASAWSALDADDVARAEREWISIVDEWPMFAERADGLGRTPVEGLGRLGGRYHVRDELIAAQRVSRRVAEVTERAWPWNNVGYLLREIASDSELGSEVGGFDLARTGFAESWKAYQRAVELAPDEPRIVNDAALIQVYHLRDDLDLAEEMLLKAARLGEQRLEALGPEVDEGVRFQIAQAVGDAYQNLGFLYQRLRDDPAKARDYLVRSVQTDSGVRRNVVGSIRSIDGQQSGGLQPRAPAAPEAPKAVDDGPPTLAAAGGTPSSSSEPKSTGMAPSGRPTERKQVPTPAPSASGVPWERSIDIAQSSASEGQRVLVYHRVGDGLGPSVEYLQRYLASEGFARATRNAVTVLADRLRHTFVDRRRDGRLVFCPRSGGLTCAEHIKTAEQFEWRWRTSGRGVMGRASNGLFEVLGDELGRVDRIEDTFERLRPGWEEAHGAAANAAELEARAPADANTPVEQLVGSPTRDARRELERRVFDPQPSSEREFAVRALGTTPSPDNDELLTAIGRQIADEELTQAALGAWRAELGPELLLRALQVCTQAETRSAAVRALASLFLDSHPHLERLMVARWVLEASGETNNSSGALAELERVGVKGVTEAMMR